MAGTYELENLNVNRATDQGRQQISIRPYGAVTSLNANQLLDHIVEHGVYNQDVIFSTSGQELTLTIPAGFVAYVQDEVRETRGDVTQTRPYIVRVAFSEDAQTSYNFGDFSTDFEFVNEDRGNIIGEDPPSTARRLFLAIAYSWEEGMLGSAADAGDGSGSGSVGRYANLFLTELSPSEYVNLHPGRYKRTIFLGEILNLDDAAVFDASTGEWNLVQSNFRFRSQIWSSRTNELFEKLRYANSNFHISYNPTGDYVYVNAGSVTLGNEIISIPRGLRHRIRAVVPEAFVNDTPPNIFHIAGDLSYTADGIPQHEGSDIPHDDSSIIGQYDMLLIDRHGDIGWATRLMRFSDEELREDPYIAVEGKEDSLYREPASQTPTTRYESGSTTSIDSVVSRVLMDLDDVYLVLLVLRRVYDDDGTRKTLPSVVWPSEPWELYRHNPFLPFVSDPAVVRGTAVSETLVIPVEDNE